MDIISNNTDSSSSAQQIKVSLAEKIRRAYEKGDVVEVNRLREIELNLHETNL